MKVKLLMAVILLVFAVTASAQRGGDPTQRAEMQTKMMADSLSLSSRQGEKVKEINLKYANKQTEARQANADGDWEQMRAKMEALRTEQNAELKTVLTNEQYERWQKITAEQWKQRGGNGRGADDKDGKGRKDRKDTPPQPPPTPEQGGGN
jgi:hypothetical protein